MGQFVTGVTVVTTIDARPAPGDHRQRPVAGLARAAARDGRARPAAVHQPDGPGGRPLRGQRPGRGPAGPVRLLRPRAGEARAARTSAARPGTPGPTGLPLLDGAIATLECTVVETFPAGDHDLFIGRVDALDDSGPAAEAIGPLLYFRRRYLRIEQAAHADGRGEAGGLSVPFVHANGLDVGYDVVGAGPPARRPPRRDVGRAGGLRGPAAALLEGLPRPPARRPRPRPDALGRRARLPLRLARRRPRGLRRRARPPDASTSSASRWAG